MADDAPVRVTEIKQLISTFLQGRLEEKLSGLSDDDPKRGELKEQFIFSNWLDDAAKRVGQIQAVTHSLKPAHPGAKGTNLYCHPNSLSSLPVVGSHCLGDGFAVDVVGNAAALDVYKFLKQTFRETNLLGLALEHDTDLIAALSDDVGLAAKWVHAFASLTDAPDRIASHSLAKQIYWLSGQDADPKDDAGFHLLAPLYASSLAQEVYLRVQEDRFGEEAKSARQSRREKRYDDRVVREYPDLAIQKLGGTKPQNISQLNSERRGDNLLLASLPPNWKSRDISPLLKTTSMFERYGRRPEVRRTLQDLLGLLKSDPASNVRTRERRDALLENLNDEFMQYSAELRMLEPGWTQVPECRLSLAEQYWLDPQGCEASLAPGDLPVAEDIAEKISALFAYWLNDHLRDPLAMDDESFLYWRKTMNNHIEMELREGRYEF